MSGTDVVDTFIVSNTDEYLYWGVQIVSSTTGHFISNGFGYHIQFYPLNSNGSIVNDSTAMRLIGEKNYAANTLLDDLDWRKGICDSDYFESVLNTKVPILTEDSPNVLESSMYGGYKGWKVFDGTNSSDTDCTGGDVPMWVGYKFPSSVKVCKFFYENRNSGSNVQAPKDFTIQGSNDDFVSDIHILESYTNTNQTSKYRFADILDTVGSYSSYRMHITTYYATRPFIAMLQFYGRQDVDETVYNIYSAANDTVSITGNGVSLTCTTDSSGHGTIAKSNLSVGTYTFTSSVALDPDNLDGSHYYSKQIVVTGKEIEILVMPNGEVLYWYGYINEAETLSNANGWTNEFGTNIFVNPTYNANSVQVGISTRNYSGIGSKNPIKSGSVVSVIYKATSLNSGSCFYLQFEDTKYIPGTNVNNLDNTVESVYHSSQLNGNKYASLAVALGGSSSAKAGFIYALWYE